MAKKKFYDRVTNVVGGRDLANYFGSKIAKKNAPAKTKKYVSDKVSPKRALASGANVAMALTGGAGFVGRKAVAKTVAKAASKRAAAKRSIKKEARELGESSFAKRGRRYEQIGFKQAAKRNAAKKAKKRALQRSTRRGGAMDIKKK